MSTSAEIARWPRARGARSSTAASAPWRRRCGSRARRSGRSPRARSIAHRRASPRSSPATDGIVGSFQRRAGQRRHLARDAEDRQAVGAVRRELERDQRVVEREHCAHVRARPARPSAARAGPRGRRTARARAPSTACPAISTPRSVAALDRRWPPGSIGADQRAAAPSCRRARSARRRRSAAASPLPASTCTRAAGRRSDAARRRRLRRRRRRVNGGAAGATSSTSRPRHRQRVGAAPPCRSADRRSVRSQCLGELHRRHRELAQEAQVVSKNRRRSSMP